MNTLKTRYNKSEGTNDFLLYRGVLLLQGLFTIRLTTKGLRIKFVIAGILLLQVLLLRSFNVLDIHLSKNDIDNVMVFVYNRHHPEI
jgi:hypothetical protein